MLSERDYASEKAMLDMLRSDSRDWRSPRQCRQPLHIPLERNTPSQQKEVEKATGPQRPLFSFIASLLRAVLGRPAEIPVDPRPEPNHTDMMVNDTIGSSEQLEGDRCMGDIDARVEALLEVSSSSRDFGERIQADRKILAIGQAAVPVLQRAAEGNVVHVSWTAQCLLLRLVR